MRPMVCVRVSGFEWSVSFAEGDRRLVSALIVFAQPWAEVPHPHQARRCYYRLPQPLHRVPHLIL
jgi:hypothetical protein